MTLNPNTLQGMTDATVGTKIDADSLATKTDGVPDSNFSYSIWFYINDWNYRYGKPKVLFGRMGGKAGSGSSDSHNNSQGSGSGGQTQGPIDGIGGKDPCPVVTLGAKENNLMVALGCYPGADEEPTTVGGATVVHTCGIGNIPIQKWTNLIISVYGRTLDIYIDGKLVRTCLLPGVAKVNDNAAVIVTPMGGFDGWTSKFQYYSDSLNTQQAWNIYEGGYKNGLFAGSYQLQMNLISNGSTQSTYTVG
tara:strand:- start:1936 stop:2682 length:747 start_codon:yes stop_codon:yes gene_type:complete